MFGGIARAIFGSQNDRILKGLRKHIEAINGLESEMAGLSDEALQAKTAAFRERLANGETVDDLMEEAFAVVREAAKRVLGQRHFDVQLLGGLVLHQGKISEMKTGEGKTLVATLPVYLNALPGKGVHVVTVNDYLAQRDAGWMGRVYNFLGLTVGCIVHGLDDSQRKAAYACDVTYGTNNEFGFDYLRDNMKFRLEDMAQREFHYAIVDEVDSILIDEARTPLIISGPADDSSQLYRQIDALIPSLKEEHYEKDEKQRTVALTDDGTEEIERLLVEAGILQTGALYDVHNVSLVHHANQALRAHKLFSRDTDYIVKDDKVVIIDEFTGRAMEGRRYSDGLHQALEAKERVTVQNENQTLASITFQNYFRLYPKLAGMTGTAMTEAGRVPGSIYGLEVVEIPTNVPCIARRTTTTSCLPHRRAEKFEAIFEMIEDVPQAAASRSWSAPSRSRSPRSSPSRAEGSARSRTGAERPLPRAGGPRIIAQAGRARRRDHRHQHGRPRHRHPARRQRRHAARPGAGNRGRAPRPDAAEITTPASRKSPMRNRQGPKALKQAGGLCVIATERHESRRIDNQLRGRSGRQGDPGRSTFFLSLEDDLMRIFGSDRMDGMLKKLGLQDGEAIVHPWINKALEKAQQKVEARNFEIRKKLLKFDDVMNDQRKVVYEQRREIMRLPDVHEMVTDMRQEVIEDMVARAIPEGTYSEQWDLDGLHADVMRLLGLDLPVQDWGKEEGIAEREILERVRDASNRRMAEKTVNFGRDLMRMAEKQLLLQLLDQQWKDHLLSLDHLRQGINLRAYAQKDPLNEYKREAFSLFEAMLADLRGQVTAMLSHLEIRTQSPEEIEARMAAERLAHEMHETRDDPALASDVIGTVEDDQEMRATGTDGIAPARAAATRVAADPNDPATWGKVQRNAPCPCGSGKKYKHCHGALN